MAQERKATTAEFYKFTKQGQACAGRVTRYGKTDNGPFVVFEPVLIRRGFSEKWERFGTVAVGLSTDLNMKVTEKDVGKFLFFEFADKEPSKKGSPRKVFRVLELTQDEIKEYAQVAVPGTVLTTEEDTEPVASGSGNDDLPF